MAVMQKEAKPKFHLLYIDGLRAIAAINVVIGHAILQDRKWYNVNIIQNRFLTAFTFGHNAVDLFIVLSGFCLMLPVIKANYQLGDLFYFYKRRIIRILPPYFLAMLLTLLMIHFFIGKLTGSKWDVSIPVTKKDIILHLFLIHDVFRSTVYKINNVFWSISVEFRIYLFFPFLLYIWRKKGAFATLISSVIIAAILCIATQYIHHHYIKNVNVEVPGVNPYIILFSLGMIAADISYSKSKLSKLKGKLSWGWISILCLTIFVVLYRNPLNMGNYWTLNLEILDIVFGLVTFCTLIFLAKVTDDEHNQNWLKLIVSWKPLVFLGMFAYSLYLIHYPFLQIFTQYVLPHFQLSKFEAICTMMVISLLTIPIAYVFFLICEKPFLKMGKKKNIKKTELNAAVNPAP